MLTSIFDYIKIGERISDTDAAMLYQDSLLAELAIAANHWRFKHNPTKNVTYLIDRNINYTNVCNTDCTFCAFYRHSPTDPESYVNSKEVIGKKIEEALTLGATRILLQGGHNDTLSYDYYLDLINWINQTYGIEINSFSPSEIAQISKVAGKNYRDVLTELKSAGMRGLPGGGAELLDDDVKKRVSPKKISADTWIEIMEIAQELKLTTTATMVIGFGETIEQRINHLRRLRNLQDRSLKKGLEGFNLFISWPLQLNENTSLGRSSKKEQFGTSTIDYLRNLAIARIYLDNIPHHQASWPSCGPDVATIGLHIGCDDFGSTMIEENVVSQAGGYTEAKSIMTPNELCQHIQDAGFIPRQRNTSFDVV